MARTPAAILRLKVKDETWFKVVRRPHPDCASVMQTREEKLTSKEQEKLKEHLEKGGNIADFLPNLIAKQVKADPVRAALPAPKKPSKAEAKKNAAAERKAKADALKAERAAKKTEASEGAALKALGDALKNVGAAKKVANDAKKEAAAAEKAAEKARKEAEAAKEEEGKAAARKAEQHARELEQKAAEAKRAEEAAAKKVEKAEEKVEKAAEKVEPPVIKPPTEATMEAAATACTPPDAPECGYQLGKSICGTATVVETAVTGTKIPARYCLVDAYDLNLSNNVDASYSLNAAYPAILHDHNKQPAAAIKALALSGKKFIADPKNVRDRFVNPKNAGMPVTLEDGTVACGTGYLLGIRLMYAGAEATNEGNDYRETLRNLATDTGFSAAAVKKIKNPVIVRVIKPAYKSFADLKPLFDDLRGVSPETPPKKSEPKKPEPKVTEHKPPRADEDEKPVRRPPPRASDEDEKPVRRPPPRADEEDEKPVRRPPPRADEEDEKPVRRPPPRVAEEEAKPKTPKGKTRAEEYAQGAEEIGKAVRDATAPLMADLEKQIREMKEQAASRKK